MKYIIALGDGMADEYREDLGGKTPVEYAKTPNMDKIAQEGICQFVQTVPHGMAPGSDVANMSVMGYAPEKYHTGRAPIEAASMGVALADDDIAFRCNFVHVVDGKMDSYSAGHIETADAAQIIEDLKVLNCDKYQFHTGISYRHLLVVKGCGTDMKTVPPHDISGEDFAPHLPSGVNSELIREIMDKASEVLANSETNKKRAAAGKKTVNSIWPWGEGTAPTYPSLEERYGITGSVISAVDLVKGIGHLGSMDVVAVDGATGYLGTNYAGKVAAAKEALETNDFVYVHVEAPDETSHEGNLEKKLQAIEEFDDQVVGELLKFREIWPDIRIACLPDHPTYVRTKTHASDAVPFAMSGPGISPDAGQSYCERTAKESGVTIESGVALFDQFIKG